MGLKNINESTSTFWSLGNNPTQKVNNLSAFYVVEHLKLLYLLSDKVLAAGSFYFESEITRKITKKLQRLFEEGEILYFINEDIENFEEHAFEKAKKSPKSLEAYADKDLIKQRAKKLDSLASPLRRPPSSISDKIVELWLREIQSEEDGTLGAMLKSIVKEKDKRVEISLHLSKFAVERKKDFVWEYLQPYLSKLKLSKRYQNAARRKLSQLYSVATAEILEVSLDRNDLLYGQYISENKKYDTAIFDECMKILGVSEAIKRLNSLELMKLKSSEAFIYFREFYFSLIESSSYNSLTAKKALTLFAEVETAIANKKTNLEDFFKSFAKLCNDLNISSKVYEKPFDIIMNRFDTFNKGTVTSFLDLLRETEHNKSVNSIGHSTIKIANSGSAFYLAHRHRIDKIITDKFQIPKTDAPGRFGEMSNIIIKWFDNFRNSEYELALLILENITFFSEHDVNLLLDKMQGELRKIFNDDFSTVNFFGLGDSGGDSGEQFLYRLRQKLNLAGEHFPRNYDNILPHIQSIVFVDDIVGSGRQATDFCNEKLDRIKTDKYYFSLLAFEDGMRKIKKESAFKGVFSTQKLSESDKAFSETSEIFPDKELRDKIKEMCQRYGEKLYPQGPLGYDDSQALIAFSHNTPNNTLPIIWASNKNEKTIGEPWNPLWERKKVLKRKKNG